MQPIGGVNSTLEYAQKSKIVSLMGFKNFDKGGSPDSSFEFFEKQSKQSP